MRKVLSVFVILCSLAFAKDATRFNNGKPAPAYWQQQVDYTVNAELLPDSNRLIGKATITYYNNSPDTLHTIFWHLYQNIFKKDSEARKTYGTTGRVYEATKGIVIDSLTMNGNLLPMRVNSTIMETPLATPLLPNSKTEISVQWNYRITTNPDLRTGSNESEFGLGQWYPQIAVYDDWRGWDTTQYLGQAEFYTEYGNWDAQLTVPANHIIAATGTLQNSKEVLTPEQLLRLDAISKDSTTAVIPASETDSARLHLKEEKRMWRFTAQHVRDFAWASSPRFVWDAAKTESGKNIYAFYLPKERRAESFLVGETHNWDQGAAFAKRTIEFFSSHYGEYPYPQATVVSGPVEGMEYPMLAFIESGDAITSLMYGTVVHELGHQWFPMTVGSHESNYAFMDEGFTQFISSTLTDEDRGANGSVSPALAEKFGSILPNNNEQQFNLRFLMWAERHHHIQSLLTDSYLMPRNEYGTTVYFKTSAVMCMLRDVLGKELFERAMKEYFERWKFKHPLPHDFFNTIEDVAGYNLDWFWHEWFEETYMLDLAVRGVKNEQTDSGWTASIELENLGRAIMPATVRLYLADKTTKDVRVPVTAWMYRTKYTDSVRNLAAKVDRAELDPDLQLLDLNRMNNTSGLPKIECDYGFNILNQVFYPLDSYRINFAPAVGFNNRDGIEIGTSITGNYLLTDYNTNVTVKYGTRSGIPDFLFSYSTPVSFFSPDLSTGVKGFRLDGRTGYQWTLDATWERYNSIYSTLKRTFGISAGIYGIALCDASYLDNPAEWNSGNLAFGTISFRYNKTYSWGKSSFVMTNEFGTPWSAFTYAKYTADARIESRLFAGITSKLRIFAGTSEGNIPAQTSLSLLQASPLEQFESWTFRTPWTSRSLRSHFVDAGGGNMFITHDT
ncbi:MAG: M1 family metallopeptidase, partial [Bacteroidota bacterium]|nr:M1 family metallopeptidase [Bacteroidota bacterium]